MRIYARALSADEIKKSYQRFEKTPRARHNLRALRRIGVTDIIQLMVRGNKTYFPANHPYAIREGARNCDPLLTLVKAAAKERIAIWIKLQVDSNAYKAMCARDRHGKPYLRAGRLTCPDMLSPAYRQFLHDMIDRFAGKYNQWGSMRGFYVDMPFGTWYDFFGDDIPTFDKFFRERFGESLPRGIQKKPISLATANSLRFAVRPRAACASRWGRLTCPPCPCLW